MLFNLVPQTQQQATEPSAATPAASVGAETKTKITTAAASYTASPEEIWI